MAIDENLMDKVGMSPYEKILVGNITNGERFETYAIPAERGSKMISLNGAAAHKGEIGHLVVILSFVLLDENSLSTHQPRIAILGDGNEIMSTRGI